LKVCSVVLGGYVNGYGIISELYDKTKDDIILFDTKALLASKSNKIKFFKKISNDSNSLKKALFELKEMYYKIILFPTSDLYLENLYKIYDEVNKFCFIPINKKTFLKTIRKDVQYQYCRELKIPIPKSIILNKGNNILEQVQELIYPLIIKPVTRDDMKTDVFRNLILDTPKSLRENLCLINKFLDKGILFLVSEFIIGDDDKLYSHVGYRTSKGKIVEDWIGHKLSQFPPNNGVVSVGTNQAPDIVRQQGKLILDKMDMHGLFQVEFKYDSRDKKFKLMEVNLRSMMWHKLGFASGFYANYALYLDATNKNLPKTNYKEIEEKYFLYMKHEFFNLILSKGNYIKKFFKHLTFKNKVFAVWDYRDPIPFIYDTLSIIKSIIFKIFIRKKNK